MENDLINTNLIFIILGMVVAVLGLSLFIFGIRSWFTKRGKISTRLNQFVAAEIAQTNASTERPIIPREINGSLLNRTVLSWFKKLIQLLGRSTPNKVAGEIEHKLTVAGNPFNLHAAEFFAMRFLAISAGFLLAIYINRDIKNLSVNSILFGVLIFIFLSVLPDVWLRGRIRSRKNELSRGLPDALDMLSVCASAGLGFDQSLQKISGYWDTELGREFRRVTQEMEMGVSRVAALKNMSDRVDVNDISQFISISIQAEKIGMSYAEVLHSQALQMRELRRFRAREIANKLPGKMIIPIVLFIFPAIMAVILGPAIPSVMDLFSSMR